MKGAHGIVRAPVSLSSTCYGAGARPAHARYRCAAVRGVRGEHPSSDETRPYQSGGEFALFHLPPVGRRRRLSRRPGGKTCGAIRFAIAPYVLFVNAAVSFARLRHLQPPPITAVHARQTPIQSRHAWPPPALRVRNNVPSAHEIINSRRLKAYFGQHLRAVLQFPGATAGDGCGHFEQHPLEGAVGERGEERFGPGCVRNYGLGHTLDDHPALRRHPGP